MIKIQHFCFNEFMVNSFILYDETRSCIIVDPGCNHADQQQELMHYINNLQLKPEYIVSTHGHVDHVAGNAFLKNQFACPVLMHEADMFLLQNAMEYAEYFSFTLDKPPLPDGFLTIEEPLVFGNSELGILHVPGHSPGSICLYSPLDKFLIAGDVIFKGSIGRTDLPGGNYDLLISGIMQKIMILPRETLIWPGHGPNTSIGIEHDTNPFLS